MEIGIPTELKQVNRPPSQDELVNTEFISSWDGKLRVTLELCRILRESS